MGDKVNSKMLHVNASQSKIKKTEITIRWKAKNVSDSQKNSKKLALLRFFAMELVYNDEFDVRCVFCPLSA